MGHILDAFLQAHQLAQLIKGAQYGEQDRAYQLQQRQQAAQDRERAITSQDFNTRLALQNAGAVEQTPALANLISILGSPSSHTLTQTPVGPEYLPTRDTQDQRALDQYTAKKRADELATTEPLTLPAELGGGKVRIKIGTAIENLIKIHNAANPHLHFEAKSNQQGTTIVGMNPETGKEVFKRTYADMKADQPLHFFQAIDPAGNQTITGLDAKGQKVSTVTNEGVGKPQASAAEDKQAQVQFNRARVAKAQFERVRAEALKLDAHAQALEDAGDNEKAAPIRARADAQLQYAGTLAEDLQTNFPDFIEAGPGQADTKGKAWPYAKFIADAPTATPKKQGKAASRQPDKTGHIIGDEVIHQGKKYIYRGLTADGKMKLEAQ